MNDLFTDKKIFYITFSISIIFFSWILGHFINELLKNNKNFYPRISNFVFIRNDYHAKLIGIDWFRWIVRRTFFKYFNQGLRIKGKFNFASISELKKEMTSSEISHLIGFGLVIIIILILIMFRNYEFITILLVFNIFMNLYPTLLQQTNKKRIDVLLKKNSEHVRPDSQF